MMEDGLLSHKERRQMLSTVATMAYGRRDYDRAEEVLLELLAEAKASRDPTEIANALYNLGNTKLAAGKIDEAIDTLTLAADGCIFHELDQIAPMVFTNLGIACHQGTEPELAFQMLTCARDIFKAQNNVPGQAYVCDCLALMHHSRDEREQAEAVWRFALALYDGITNPAMQDVREGGRKDIVEKMKHLGYSHGD